MGKKQKKVNNRETETQVVKFITKRKHVNERHKNGLYSNAELTEKDKQSELYKEYIKVKYIPYCKQFLHNQDQNNLPNWGKTELAKLKGIIRNATRKCYNSHRLSRVEHQKTYRNTHTQAISDHKKNYYQTHRQAIIAQMKNYCNTHSSECAQRSKQYYERIIANIKKIKQGKLDEITEKELRSVQSLMKVIHKGKCAHSIHGLNLGDKDNNDIYARTNLEAFKDFLKSQVGVDAVIQIDFNELNNMPFDFNVLGDEEKFDNSYFNNDIIPNENHQQDNNYQPINEQEEQPIDKYGFLTYGHKTNGTNNNELFALNDAHNFNEPSL